LRTALDREENLFRGAGQGGTAQPADRRHAPPARATLNALLDRRRNPEQGLRGPDRRSRQAPQLGAGAAGAGADRYRSEFFGRLRQILSQRSDILVVGDRFVFQAEVLFQKGSADLNEEGKVEMLKLADALKQLEREIPGDIAWVLRVDGHTDADPDPVGSSSPTGNCLRPAPSRW
jgi:outer membrane protein OmpA-like peptidoglycan-associated protein